MRCRFANKQKPVHEIRLGRVRAAIWQNETEAGVRHSVTFTRLYKDGEQWEDSASCSRDNLLLLAELADAAHAWLCGSRADPQPSRGDDVRAVLAHLVAGEKSPALSGPLLLGESPLHAALTIAEVPAYLGVDGNPALRGVVLPLSRTLLPP
jgi:hypothetical protein